MSPPVNYRSQIFSVSTHVIPHVPYDVCCTKAFSYMANHLLIPHNKQNKQLQYARCVKFVNYTCLVFSFLPPLSHPLSNKRQRTSVT